MSYVIRNCPAYNETQSVYWTCYKLLCQDCPDCVMKQIVEKCKFWINAEKNNKYKTNGWILSDDILHLLDIQEVE